MSFLNKVVVITGAGSGFGAAIALNFANLSARLCLIDINEANVKKSAEICEKASRAKVLWIKVDLTKDEEVKGAIEKTVKEYGRIDVVVNNAGIMLKTTSILAEDILSSFDTVMAVNMRAAVAVSHYVAPHLIESKGNIVNISTAGISVVMANIPYSVSKVCLSNYTRCLALEMAPRGVRVNGILPFVCVTPIVEGVAGEDGIEEFTKALEKWSPMKKLIKAEEVADLVAYLASDKAKSITGSNYSLDTGLALVGNPDGIC